MPPSFRRVHYAQRPAKNIERKMLADTLARFNRVQDLSKARYIGMGSVYFTDVALMHRALGLTRIVSVEDTTDPGIRKRFETNKPFDCVKLVFGHTNDVLPGLYSGTLPDDDLDVVWLDYDDPLHSSMLTDVATVVSSAPSFSLLLVSVTTQSDRDDTVRYNLFRERVGAARVPRDIVSGSDLAGKKMAIAARRVLNDQVRRTLRTRNGGLRAGEILSAEEVFHVTYADDAAMLTVGWVLVPAGQRSVFEAMGLAGLDYLSTGDDAFDITVPKLTTRELLRLEQSMPSTLDPSLFPGLAPGDLRDFTRLYRFLPNFIDGVLA